MKFFYAVLFVLTISVPAWADCTPASTLIGPHTRTSWVEGGLVYDTTSKILKTCDGTNWNVAGNVPNAPIFSVSRGTTGSGTSYPNNGSNFILGTVNINVGSGYNNGTGVFTAPVAGYYSFSFMVSVIPDGANSINDVNFVVNNTINESIAASAASTQIAAAWYALANTVVLYLNVNDTVALRRPCCNNNKPIDWRGNFSGYFIRP